jgi:hypothetical protein
MLWETPNRTYINENNPSISVNQDNHKAARTMMFVMRSYWCAHLPSGGRHPERTLLLSGEHGIGLLKKAYLEEALGEVSVDVQRRIKAALDPAGILNPGKVL